MIDIAHYFDMYPKIPSRRTCNYDSQVYIALACYTALPPGWIEVGALFPADRHDVIAVAL